jgi:threonine dehydrogenase-like Zn-dependent dehydrogenase
MKTPFVAGNDGLGFVVKVGPGVKNLQENDWVLPFMPHLGTWRSLAVLKERDTLKIPVDLMPVEYAAMMRELRVAYRLLEDYGDLRSGDTVILNDANGTIGQVTPPPLPPPPMHSLSSPRTDLELPTTKSFFQFFFNSLAMNTTTSKRF